MCPKKTCTNCHEEKPATSEFFRQEKWGLRGECKKCRNNRLVTKYNDPNTGLKDRLQSRAKTGPTVLGNYKTEDKKKGRNNNLTLDYVREELKRPCTYCGFPSTGLDRIDNSKGHIIGNCVPCCKECNIARGDHFSTEEMLKLGQTIRQIKLKRQKHG